MRPGKFATERLALARDMLETSTASVDDVARTCGLGTVATLRHHFRRRLNKTPTAHRLHFHRGYPEIVARAAAEQRVAIAG